MERREPIFVVGGARSGTTFLAKLFDSHPDVLYRHEPDSVLVNTQIPFLPRNDKLEQYLPVAGRYLDALREVRVTKVSGQRPIFDKSFRSTMQKRRFLANLYFAKFAERAGQYLGRKHVEIPDCIDAQSRDRIVYAIKSVDTPWRTLLYSRARPTWRFVHILRHPCAMISSKLAGIELNVMEERTYLRPAFDAGMADDYPFTLEDMESRSYEQRAAFLWMICNQKIHDDMAENKAYCLVIYEDLCQNLKASTRQLYDFAGLSMADQTQHFLDALGSNKTDNPGYFNILRSPLSGINKWRERLTNRQMDDVARIVCHSSLGQRFLESDRVEKELVS